MTDYRRLQPSAEGRNTSGCRIVVFSSHPRTHGGGLMSSEKVRSRRLQEQPVEGDRDVIDRELARKNEGQKVGPADRGSRKRSKVNPDATPGTGMLPPTDGDDD